MKRWKEFLAIALFAAVGCSGITANSNTAPGANLGKYHTYAWYQPPSGEMQSIAEQEVRSSLERQLAQKGLTMATTQPPDFLVAYHATKQQKVNVTPGYGYGYGYWGYRWGGFPDVSTYTEGTLVVDFIDPQSNQVFWRGSAQGVVENPNNPDPQRIDTAVAKLVKQYPMQVASVPRPAM
jgi:Domain of unknown function (DUF4136)